MLFYPLEKLINLRDGYRRQFKIDALQLLLMQEAGERYLFEAFCPHRGHPLDQASISESLIQCPLHQYCFSLQSGRVEKATEEPCRALQVFELVYEGNEIGVILPEKEADSETI
jgi:nitrite reductase/ring-hydroxylating ferredoxin subunit